MDGNSLETQKSIVACQLNIEMVSVTDFFISYNSADRSWAEWVGYVLEEQGFSVIIQAWDFRPGSNFVLEMQAAASTAERTIMILSPDYLKSQFTAPEWAAAFANDPQGLDRKLIPIKVRNCQPAGLLASIVHIKLENTTEAQALDLLLAGIRGGRSKPTRRPVFPGKQGSPRAFPGAQPSENSRDSSPYIPTVRGRPTDAEKRRFIRTAFEAIRSYFEVALKALSERLATVECDFQERTATDFVAEVFVNGSSKCRCRIRQGGAFGQEGISFSEGRVHFDENSFNEMLSISESEGNLHLSSVMGSFGPHDVDFDLKKMSQRQAAEYLWRRFVRALEG